MQSTGSPSHDQLTGTHDPHPAQGSSAPHPSSSSLSSALGNPGPHPAAHRHPSGVYQLPTPPSRNRDDPPTGQGTPPSSSQSWPAGAASTNLTNAAQLVAPGPPSVPAPIFEFTKRKRWADLLVMQLSEAILLILSPSADVLYCGSAVWALLGWQDHELVDRCFLDFMNADDRKTFERLFTESIINKTDLTSYTRLQYKPSVSPLSSSSLGLTSTPTNSGTGSYPQHSPTYAPHYHRHDQLGYPNQYARPQSQYQQPYVQPPQPQRPRDQTRTPSASAMEGRKEVLFEIIGAPYFLPLEDTLKCFFAVAKPYPSRNTAILNTFLELKLENERLHDRLAQLKLAKESRRKPASPTVSHSHPHASSSSSSSSTLASSTSPSTSIPTLSTGISQPTRRISHGSGKGNLQVPAATSFFSGTYDELMSLPGQAASRASGPGGYRFENLFDVDGTLTLDSSSAAAIDAVGGGGGNATVQIPPAGSVSGPSGGAGVCTPGDHGAAREDEEAARKKAKKAYLPEQYVCMTCGRTDSPEWRKGPSGPKTLCNACGLRWAKREKERRVAARADSANASGSGSSSVGGPTMK